MFLYLCEADYAGSSREKRKEAFIFLCIVFCRPLFVFLSLFFWPLYCNLIQPTILISIQTFDYIYYIHWD
jgi:hypothetical protein